MDNLSELHFSAGQICVWMGWGMLLEVLRGCMIPPRFAGEPELEAQTIAAGRTKWPQEKQLHDRGTQLSCAEGDNPSTKQAGPPMWAA